MRPLAVALVHHPVLARDQSVVTTAITNLDIHDIARSAYTYGVSRFYLVHPVLAQRQLAQRVVTHWTTGSGALRIPDRKPPMQSVKIVVDLQEAEQDFKVFCASDVVETWVTSAAPSPEAISHPRARQNLAQEGSGVVLVLGTGWGLAPEVMNRATLRLQPIVSPRDDGYNHLSVRAAAAIFLDRLCSNPNDFA